ncbi:hypothetical protein BDP27DRAFT_678047 [Rhodocollybia butyracea]|uniref:Uncharacterized protein n=1 Tax=Rhodocollybia butyracea TaxID=206335 RepID=A0A9P5P8H8_9AGAR|nr:hypothetical protein BDP27DRAFT_678047 [Rhodocollybia butyracea]
MGSRGSRWKLRQMELDYGEEGDDDARGVGGMKECKEVDTQLASTEKTGQQLGHRYSTQAMIRLPGGYLNAFRHLAWNSLNIHQRPRLTCRSTSTSKRIGAVVSLCPCSVVLLRHAEWFGERQEPYQRGVLKGAQGSTTRRCSTFVKIKPQVSVSSCYSIF